MHVLQGVPFAGALAQLLPWRYDRQLAAGTTPRAGQPACGARRAADLDRAAAEVRAHAIARLRMLLSDGRGPVYDGGRGDLAQELRGVLAEL